ncbi:MAG: DpnI domain-containing protein [Stenotrophobium sp.]
MSKAPVEYRSNSQRARVNTEGWIAQNGFCPACGSVLNRTPNNTRVLDFRCKKCDSGFELKSRKKDFGKIITDGAYGSMIAAIREDRQPNLFLLRYQMPFVVTHLKVLPRRFLVEPIIIKRPPLSPNARRAGWVGCNLNLGLIPSTALIACVENSIELPRKTIRTAWEQTAALDEVAPRARGWLAVTLGTVERLGKREFTLGDVYQHENELARLFPNNRNIRAKLRQQLQLLRDMGLVRFLGTGKYEALRQKG